MGGGEGGRRVFPRSRTTTQKPEPPIAMDVTQTNRLAGGMEGPWSKPMSHARKTPCGRRLSRSVGKRATGIWPRVRLDGDAPCWHGVTLSGAVWNRQEGSRIPGDPRRTCLCRMSERNPVKRPSDVRVSGVAKGGPVAPARPGLATWLSPDRDPEWRARAPWRERA